MNTQTTYQAVSDKAHRFLRDVGCRRTNLDLLLNDFFGNRTAWENSQDGLERLSGELDKRLEARKKLSDASYGKGGLIAHLKLLEDDVSSLRSSGQVVPLETYVQRFYPGLIRKLRAALFDDVLQLRVDNLALLNHLGYTTGFDAARRKLTVVTRVGRLTLSH